TVESLIKAGAFDSLGHTRKGLIERHEQAIDAVVDIKKNEAVGQFDLFGGDDEEAASGPAFGLDLEYSPHEWDKTELLAFEREMLGLYVSDHPLYGIEHILSASADMSLGALLSDAPADGTLVNVAGILSAVQRKVTKQGNSWAIATCEDLEGAVEVMFFPNTYQAVATHIHEDAIVMVRGKVDRREDVPKLIAMDLTVPDLSDNNAHGPVVLSLPATRCTPPLVERLKEVLSTHPGTTEVHLKLLNGRRTTLLRLDAALRVDPTSALMGDLKALLGPSAVALAS
ncbi:MAG: OB-fold nucleic acid binding domain-containing protein, partial [Mycobacteriales bacterium]